MKIALCVAEMQQQQFPPWSCSEGPGSSLAGCSYGDLKGKSLEIEISECGSCGQMEKGSWLGVVDRHGWGGVESSLLLFSSMRPTLVF